MVIIICTKKNYGYYYKVSRIQEKKLKDFFLSCSTFCLLSVGKIMIRVTTTQLFKC